MKQDEIRELRNRLLELGQPIVIPAGEQGQPSTASDDSPRDITLYPFWEE